MRAHISRQSKKVSPQNGGFIRTIELAPRRFVGKANPIFRMWILFICNGILLSKNVIYHVLYFRQKVFANFENFSKA